MVFDVTTLECEQCYHIKYITFFAKEIKMHWEEQEAVS